MKENTYDYIWCKDVCTPNESSLSICTLCALNFNVKLWLAKGNGHAVCEYLFCKLPVIYATESAHSSVEEKTSYMGVAGLQVSPMAFFVWDTQRNAKRPKKKVGLPIFNPLSECKDSVFPTRTVEVDAFPHYLQTLQPAFFDGQTSFLSLLEIAFVRFPEYVYGLLGFST